MLDLAQIQGLLVRDSSKALGCVLEQETLSSALLVQPRKTGKCPNMTEKLLTGMQRSTLIVHARKMTDIFTFFVQENFDFFGGS